MKIKSILAMAESCKTDADTEALLDTLATAFSTTKPLGHLAIQNGESYLEDGIPFIGFELCQVFNAHYGLMIRPQIRDKKLTVLVVIHHMKDGRGLHSQSWQVAPGIDEIVIEADANSTVAALAKQAAETAIKQHCALIIRVGVPKEIAELAAKKSWNS